MASPLTLSDKEFARRWIEEVSLVDKAREPSLTPDELRRRDELGGRAMDAAILLGFRDPARLCRLVLDVTRATDDPFALCVLGCGPVEDVWLDLESGQVRAGLLEEWRTNRNMRDAVQDVWIGEHERARFPEAVAILEDLQRTHAETLEREENG